jgi:hypothetical protein
LNKINLKEELKWKKKKMLKKKLRK